MKNIRFLDLFNKAKNSGDFKYRTKQFKLWAYLSKKNPGEFKIEWDKNFRCFRYYRNGDRLYAGGRTYPNWKEIENSKGKWHWMGAYLRDEV